MMSHLTSNISESRTGHTRNERVDGLLQVNWKSQAFVMPCMTKWEQAYMHWKNEHPSLDENLMLFMLILTSLWNNNIWSHITSKLLTISGHYRRGERGLWGCPRQKNRSNDVKRGYPTRYKLAVPVCISDLNLPITCLETCIS